MINFPLLHEQLDWIREDMDRQTRGEEPSGLVWNQEIWFEAGDVDPETGRVNLCGSHACLAGHVALTQGAAPLVRPNGYINDEFVLFKGRSVEIDIVAAEILGLTEEQADLLFESYNTLEDLERIVKDWENESSV